MPPQNATPYNVPHDRNICYFYVLSVPFRACILVKKPFLVVVLNSWSLKILYMFSIFNALSYIRYKLIWSSWLKYHKMLPDGALQSESQNARHYTCYTVTLHDASCSLMPPQNATPYNVPHYIYHASTGYTTLDIVNSYCSTYLL